MFEARELPPPTVATLGAMFIAGVAGTTAFDLWGQLVSPGIGWANLSPHGLAVSLLGALGLPRSEFAGYFIHFYLVGLIGYPVGWLYIFEPMWRRAGVAAGGWLAASAAYGVGLWVFAIGGVTAVAGLPFFLNFTGITWVALIGHVLYAVAMVAVWRRVAPR